MILPALILVSLGVWLWPKPAMAMQCDDHWVEHFDVELVEITGTGRAVTGPSQVRTLDELTNSSRMGRGLLFLRKSTMGFAKFYRLTKETEPTPEVKNFIEQAKRRWMKTACGNSIPYTPILPGEYVFEEEHRDGARKSAGIDKPTLIIGADRKQVELHLGWKGEDLRAFFRVKHSGFGSDK